MNRSKIIEFLGGLVIAAGILVAGTGGLCAWITWSQGHQDPRMANFLGLTCFVGVVMICVGVSAGLVVPCFKRDDEAAVKALAGTITAAGILLAGTAGLCVVLVLPMAIEDTGPVLAIIGLAAAPLLIGLLLFAGGMALARKK